MRNNNTNQNTQKRDKIIQTRMNKDLYDYVEKMSGDLGLNKSTLIYYIVKINSETNVINDETIYKTINKGSDYE